MAVAEAVDVEIPEVPLLLEEGVVTLHQEATVVASHQEEAGVTLHQEATVVASHQEEAAVTLH